MATSDSSVYQVAYGYELTLNYTANGCAYYVWDGFYHGMVLRDFPYDWIMARCGKIYRNFGYTVFMTETHVKLI